MKLYFSDYFEITDEVLEDYGAFNISLVSDLPVFIDPFLLFNSERPEYLEQHDAIIKYLRFLRDKSVEDKVDRGLLRSWYIFKEVKQNWLGFTVMGNGGSGLGPEFANALHSNLNRLFKGFGSEQVTQSSHLEKLCLIRDRVGKDNISDFTTNLIKEYLLNYTQEFAVRNLKPKHRRKQAIQKVKFNYQTETWEPGVFELPHFDNDFVLLTPKDILTRDDTWINKTDLVDDFALLPQAIPDEQLRSQVSNYFAQQLLVVPPDRSPTKAEERAAAMNTIKEYPDLIDYYIKQKENLGDQAVGISEEKVQETEKVFVDQTRKFIDLLGAKTEFYTIPLNSYNEAMQRVKHFKHYIEHEDGYKLLNKKGKPFSNEKDVQIFFGVVWFGTTFDINREPNNGRGPVDTKVSKGRADKSIIEFKLASSTSLKKNLEHQVKIYEEANSTRNSVKVIVFYTAEQEEKTRLVLNSLGLATENSIVLIDARSDNKTSASKAESH